MLQSGEDKLASLTPELQTTSAHHQVKGAVWGDEGDGAVGLEPGQAHALVELDVLHLHRLVLAAAPLRLEQHLRACTPGLGNSPVLAAAPLRLEEQHLRRAARPASGAMAPPAQRLHFHDNPGSCLVPVQVSLAAQQHQRNVPCHSGQASMMACQEGCKD